ncbi:hypothetical protein [Frigoribacterium sp. UYMn621]|uniref:hypothetical protein n=1 Tax=Frigoribacterium sp. UYMn621 TaxID=3156343 RepID=UPI003395DBC7
MNTTTTDQTRDDATTMRNRPDLAPYMLAAIAWAQASKQGAEFDLQTGLMHGDPLPALIPGDGQASPETLAAVMEITGRVISREQYRNTAPACRAVLRRWAIQ